MNQFTVTSVILIVLHSTLSAQANVKITPIAVENKSNGKSDLKVEEARYRDPIMPEYYDRNRQGFVTSSFMDNYGGSAFDRYGYNGNINNNNNNFNSNLGTTYYDRYGPKYGGLDGKFGGLEGKFGGFDANRDKFGMSGMSGMNYGVNGGTSLENKFGSLFGTRYPPPPPHQGHSGNNGPVYGPFNSQMGGILPPELEQKTSVILPLAGAALLGIAAYALVSGPAMAAGPLIGKRRKRSLFDEKIEQHLAYRAHTKKSQQ